MLIYIQDCKVVVHVGIIYQRVQIAEWYIGSLPVISTPNDFTTGDTYVAASLVGQSSCYFLGNLTYRLRQMVACLKNMSPKPRSRPLSLVHRPCI